ncbi:MAG: metallophosphoesterase [Patescibacteria group bacterium]
MEDRPLVALSDTHLTHQFLNPRKLRYLENIIRPAKRIVIVGDWWDSYRSTFDQFVRSPWNALFPLLKQREAIYLYGNHDPEEAGDERVNLFSIRQGWEIDLRFGSFDLHFEHGHRIAPDPIARKYPWVLGLPGIGHFEYLFTEIIPTSLFGDRWLNYRGKPAAEQLRARAAEIAKSGRWLVCGHSHIAELDPEIKYANCGFIGLGRAQYLEIKKYSIGVIKAAY